ncbi:MAG: NADH:flavin oxidoreductase/NADH oxidase family protein [Parvularculaceae bacterium]|nr:NADH:flavin oxidoreductase/NADH oxidase family protein [Parvularculaceae bacterium]
MPVTIADPLTLPCGVRLKNRLVKAAMTEGLADETNRATPRLDALYHRWAEGGAGLLITGNVQVDRRFLERPGNVAIDGPQDAAAMRTLESLAASANGTGSEIIVQLSHAGRQTPIYVNKRPVAPSEIALDLPGGQFGAPRALAADEIEDVIQRFAHAASVCKAAGFAGVQAHGAHGYLISEFLNPIANRRTDEWGGSLDNRARLLLRVVAAIRAKVGSGFPVAVKLNSSDFQKGGFAFDECLQVIEWLNEEGIDFLEISGGSYEQPKMMGIEGVAPAEEQRPSTKAREAYFLQYAEEAARVAKMPLMVTGGFRSRAAMDGALASGAADLVGVARPLCVDPDICAKLLSGVVAEAPRHEKNLRLGDGFWGPNSKNAFIKALNGFAGMAFYYENIFLLAGGEEAQDDMPLFPAFLRHQVGERRQARRLKR